MVEEPDGSAAATQGQPDLPPKKGRAEPFKMIAGLVAVTAGLFTLLVLGSLAIVFVRGQAAQVATIASAAFGVVGTIVGAYFGVKAGSEQTQQVLDQAQGTLAALRHEAAKAQAFAAHLPPGAAESAVSDAQKLIAAAEASGSKPPTSS